LGVPQFVTGLTEVVSNPIHATGVGLLLFAREQQRKGVEGANISGFSAVIARLKSWFDGHF
ncbi:MAG: cell division protein FtsA, partial [Gammaproteobacteria bacterium]